MRIIAILIIASFVHTLAGCASTPADTPPADSAATACTVPFFFRAQGSGNSDRGSGRYISCEQQRCGDPVAPGDVRIITVDDDVPLEAAVAGQVGPGARYADEWFLIDPLVRGRDRDRAKRAWASMGCNLIILGDNVRPKVKDPRSARREYTQFRWGSY